jgi:hypothetical protein
MNKLDKLDIPKISSALLYFSKSKIIKENLFYKSMFSTFAKKRIKDTNQ